VDTGNLMRDTAIRQRVDYSVDLQTRSNHGGGSNGNCGGTREGNETMRKSTQAGFLAKATKSLEDSGLNGSIEIPP
jgi:hypothetical protein